MKSRSEKALFRLKFSSLFLASSNPSNTDSSISSPSAEMPLDYRAVLETDLFTFLLGLEEVPLKIHEGLVKNLSQPLHAMMTNGMKESIDRKARLKDVDPQTFAIFAEYAYSGAYRLHPVGEQTGDFDESLHAPKVAQFCKRCGGSYKLSPISHCCTRCSQYAEENAEYCIHCTDQLESDEEIESATCSECYEPLTHAQAFVCRKYHTDTMEHDELRKYLTALRPPDRPSSQLIAHARLYIFADRYLIESMKSLCLHKLHRDLTSFKLTNDTADELFALLQFTDNNTESYVVMDNEDPVTDPGMGKELRDLVVAYAVLQAESLVKYAHFKTMLVDGGSLLAEFTCLLASRPKV